MFGAGGGPLLVLFAAFWSCFSPFLVFLWYGLLIFSLRVYVFFGIFFVFFLPAVFFFWCFFLSFCFLRVFRLSRVNSRKIAPSTPETHGSDVNTLAFDVEGALLESTGRFRGC